MSAVWISVALAPSDNPTQVPVTPSQGSSLQPEIRTRRRARRRIAGSPPQDWSDRQQELVCPGIVQVLQQHTGMKLTSLQLARLVDAAPEGDDWLHEQKFDGYRILATLDHGDVELLSRRFNDWTDQFPTVVEAVSHLRAKR